MVLMAFQNLGKQKQHHTQHNVPTRPFYAVCAERTHKCFAGPGIKVAVKRSVELLLSPGHISGSYGYNISFLRFTSTKAVIVSWPP